HPDPDASLGQFERGLGCQPDLARSRETGSVKEERQPDTASVLQCPPPPLEICAPRRLAKHRQRTAVASEQLARGGAIARTQRIDFAHTNRIDAELLRNA